MKILIACEYSGTVRDAFIAKGHDAISCDLLPSESDFGPHYQGDVFDIINDGFDLMIAHPPCTYLSRAGARWLYPKGKLNQERYAKLLIAQDFWMNLYCAEIDRVAIENPTPFKIAGLPKPTQVIQPYQFGQPYSKRTLLWIKGLPALVPTSVLSEYKSWLPSNTSGFRRGQKSQKASAPKQGDYARTFQGIADAMADQWGIL